MVVEHGLFACEKKKAYPSQVNLSMNIATFTTESEMVNG